MRTLRTCLVADSVRARDGGVVRRRCHAPHPSTLLATSAARVHSDAEVQCAAGQSLLWTIARPNGPDVASRIEFLIPCERCGAAKLASVPCFVCARLINISARGLTHSENEASSLEATGSAALSLRSSSIPPRRRRGEGAALFRGVA
jgi:hypothetical protein